MPINYTLPKETYALLSFYRADVDAHEISKLLGLEPTSIRLRGTKNLLGLVSKESCWQYSTETFVSKKNLGVHIQWLLEKTSLTIEKLDKLRDEGYRASLSGYYLSDYENAEIHLAPELLLKIGQLNLPFWLDVYF